jgi:hypothetical protein
MLLVPDLQHPVTFLVMMDHYGFGVRGSWFVVLGSWFRVLRSVHENAHAGT